MILSYLNSCHYSKKNSTFALIWEYPLRELNVTVCLPAFTKMVDITLIKYWKKTWNCVSVMFFWFMTLCGLVGGCQAENWNDTFLWNIGNHLQDHTLSQPITPWLTFSPQWEPQIWNCIFLIVKVAKLYVDMGSIFSIRSSDNYDPVSIYLFW